MIYFLQPVDGGPVKIGTTENVPSRHRQLESHYGVPMALLSTMPGGINEEREIHDRFSHLRLGRTEQFRPAADLMAFIGRPLLVGQNTEVIEAIPVSPNHRPIVAQLKGSEGFKAWFESLMRHSRLPASTLIEHALIEYAVAHGFSEKPPER